MKKTVKGLLILFSVICAASCSLRKEPEINIEIANISREQSEEYNKMIKKKYSNVNISPSGYIYNTENFDDKMKKNMVGDLFTTWFTEVDKIVDSGYAYDITEYMNEYKFNQYLKPEYLKMVTRNDKAYGIPYACNGQGICINKKLFRDAGLVDDNGNIRYPDNYEELALMAQTIKEKTGVTGFGFPTTNNQGGYRFMNIAWSNGVVFEKQDDKGNWYAAFDTPEFKKSLQYVKDLKWKYNVLSDNLYLDDEQLGKMFANDQVAMMFASPPGSSLVKYYNVNKDNIMMVRVPKGDKGRYSLMGGNIYMINANCSKEQVEACFKYLDVLGETPVSVNNYEKIEQTLRYNTEHNYINLDINSEFPLWVNDPRDTKQKHDLVRNYQNVDSRDFEDYYSFRDVIYTPEEQVCCQDLYKVLDECLRSVISDENSDIDKITGEAAEKFDANYLAPFNAAIKKE